MSKATLLALSIVACGGAPAAKSADSHLALTLAKAEPRTVTGPALAVYDVATNDLTVMVFFPETRPSPTCTNVKDIAAKLEKGGMIAVVTDKFEGRPGTFPAMSFSLLRSDPSKGDLETAIETAPVGTNLVVHSVARDVLDATIVSDLDSTSSHATGRVKATLCKPR